MYQSAIAARAILGEDGPPADYRAVPHVTFTDPEVGSVGMTEQQARDSGLTVRIGLTDLTASTRGWIHKTGNDGLIKLVEDADRGVLVGATAVGPSGGEVLSALAVAVHAEVPTSTLAVDDLRVPDVPPRDRVGREGPRCVLTKAGARTWCGEGPWWRESRNELKEPVGGPRGRRRDPVRAA